MTFELEAHPAAALIPLLDGGEFRQLRQNIQARGLLEPIVLLEGKVLDGRNRLRACKELGIEPRFKEWNRNDGDPYEYVWSQNAERRHLAPGQKVALRARFDKAIEELRAEVKREANKKRAKAAKGNQRARKKTVGGNVATYSFEAPSEHDLAPEPASEPKSKTREKVATIAGVSARTAQKALTLQAKAPELLESVCSGKASLSAAFREFQNREVVRSIEAEPPPLPEGPFRVIVADPPWAYTKRAGDGSHRGTIPYPPMDTDKICALPIASLASDNAILWLWTTNAFLADATRVIRAWGFEQKTMLTWIKPRMGVGDWLRGQSEPCLFAVRGRPKVKRKDVSTVLQAPVREHSRKPDEFYELVESHCPGSKVELFAREARRGWRAWGAESMKFNKAE